MKESLLAAMAGKLALLLGLATVTIDLVLARCPSGSSTLFERTAGIEITIPETDPPYPLERFDNASPTECYDYCNQEEWCQSFFVDHQNRSCLFLKFNAEALLRDVKPNPSWTYQRKFCLNESSMSTCRKQWAFDRVSGSQLFGYDDKTLQSVATRDKCLEACAHESTFVCRSARYEPDNEICVLSRYDRRTAPEAFKKSAINSVDYLESQCIEEPTQCQFIPTEGQSVVHGHMVIDVTATTKEECERSCVFYSNFTCRSFEFDSTESICFISPDDSQSLLEGTLKEQENRTFVRRGSCIDVEMHCESTSMTAVVKVATPFRGRVYALGHPYECYAVAVSDIGEVSLTMPLHGRRCGSRNLGNGTFTNSILVQHHPFVLRNTDRRINVACDYEEAHQKLKIGKEVVEGELQTLTQVVTGLAPTPPIRLRVLDATGQDVSGADLGDPLTLKVEILDESVFGIFGSGLVARSGEGSETVLLLDDSGCPIEPSVFPALEQQPGSKSLVAPFQAFRFASDSTVKFQMTVSFCLDSCSQVICKNESKTLEATLGRRKRNVDQLGLQSGDVVTDVTMESALFVVKSLKPTHSTGEKGSQKLELPEDLSTPVIVPGRGLCFSRPIFYILSSVAGVLQLVLFCSCLSLLVLGRRSRRKVDATSTIDGSRASISSKSQLFRRS